MDSQIRQLGSISFLNEDIEDESTKKSSSSDKEKCEAKLKIVFDGEPEILCINSFEGEKSNLAILKEKASFYCLYLKSNEQERGYYYDEKNNKVLIFDKIDEQSFLVYLGIIKKEEGQEVTDITDYHFDGGSALKIEEDYEFIKKEYTSDNTKKIIIGMVAFIAVFLFLAINLLFDEEPPPPPPPPPAISPLNEKQIVKLKSQIALKAISDIKELVNKISKDPLVNEGKQRIIAYKLGKMSILSPERAVKRGDGSYYYKHANLKRGGIEVEFDKTYQIIYPKEGYVLSGYGIYTKDEKERKIYTPDLIDKMKFKPLSKECIETAMDISPKNTLVYERKNADIRFKFKDINASDFLEKSKSILVECPAYLEDVSVVKGTFQGDLILFAEERI